MATRGPSDAGGRLDVSSVAAPSGAHAAGAAGQLLVAVRREIGVALTLAVLAVAAACGWAAWTAPPLQPETWGFQPTEVWPWWPGPPNGTLTLFVSVVLALGLAAFLRRPHSGVSQALLAAAAGNAGNVALWATIRPDELAGPTWSWAAYVAAGQLSMVLWSSLVHLIFVFPTRDRLLDRWPWLVPAIHGVPQLLLLGDAVVSGALTPASLDWVDSWSRLHAAIVSLLLVVALGGLFVRVSSISQARRRQVAAIALAVAVAVLANLLLIHLPVAFGGAPIVERAALALVALPIPILLALALWQDRNYRLDRLRRSQMALLHAREEERRKIRRDLHDGLGPTLAAVGLKVDTAASLVRSDPAATERLLTEIHNDLAGAMAETRRLVRGLRPPGLAEEGLPGAVRRLAQEFSPDGARGPAIQVAAGDLPPLPAAVEVAAYRIIHESLANAVRHSGATQAAVQLELRSGSLEIEVTDDGAGFDTRGRRGVGTESMRERAEELGGECWITSTPGTGTRVLATLPLAPG